MSVVSYSVPPKGGRVSKPYQSHNNHSQGESYRPF